MRLKRILKEYFTYTASEKRSLLILLVILFVVYLIPVVFNRVEKGSNSFDLEKQQELNAILSEMTKEKSKEKLLKPISFDPNIVSIEELEKMGLNQYQIKNIVKYRESGGRFFKKEDFKKIYGIKLKDYEVLKPYIRIKKKTVAHKSHAKRVKKYVAPTNEYLFEFDPNTVSENGWDSLGVSVKISNRIRKYLATGARFSSPEDLKKIYGFDSSRYSKLEPYINIANLTKLRIVEINSASDDDLQSLPGIGPVLSERILKYKKSLGGFLSKEQLKEVYGLSNETFERIKDIVKVDENFIVELDLNVIEVGKLKRHPYISFRQAMDLVRYRERKGKYKNIEDISRFKLLPDSVYVKVKPYLKL